MKVGFLIGRFQGIHPGHIDLIKTCASQVDRLIIIIGSVNVTSTIKNPYSYQERVSQIKFHLGFSGANVSFQPINDYKYNDSQWIIDLRSIIDLYDADEKILFGSMKPGNDYLTWFKDIKYVNIDSDHTVNGTMTRELMYKNGSGPVFAQEDWNYVQKENEKYLSYPYPQTLNLCCADSLVECDGHVLLIQRKFAPGRNTLALPGGHKNSNETFAQCSIRELMEETNLRVPRKVLLGSLVGSELFDSPTRSQGIPRVTMCYHYRILRNPDGTLPRANGTDDAKSANWVPLIDIVQGGRMFDDHLFIICKMLNLSLVPAHLTGIFV